MFREWKDQPRRRRNRSNRSNRRSREGRGNQKLVELVWFQGISEDDKEGGDEKEGYGNNVEDSVGKKCYFGSMGRRWSRRKRRNKKKGRSRNTKSINPEYYHSRHRRVVDSGLIEK